MRKQQSLTKVTLNLFAGDLERLHDLHPRLSASEVVRLLVRHHLHEAGIDVPEINLAELELDQ